MPQCNIESISEMPHLGLLPLDNQIRLYSSFQKEHKWNRSSWLEKGSRSSESWSCCLCEGCCKWSWLLLERILREDKIREPKILLQLRTDSYNTGKIFWSHCWLFSKLIDHLCNSRQRSQWGSGHHREKYWEWTFQEEHGGLEKVQRRKTATIKGM